MFQECKSNIKRSPPKQSVYRPLLKREKKLSIAKAIPISKTDPYVGNDKNTYTTKFDEKNNIQIHNLHDTPQPLPISDSKFNFEIDTSPKNRVDVQILRRVRMLPQINASLVQTEPLVNIKTESLNINAYLTTNKTLANSQVTNIAPSTTSTTAEIEPLLHKRIHSKIHKNNVCTVRNFESLFPTSEGIRDKERDKGDNSEFKFYLPSKTKDIQKDKLQDTSFESLKERVCKFKLLTREKNKEDLKNRKVPETKKRKEVSRSAKTREDERKIILTGTDQKGKNYLT